MKYFSFASGVAGIELGFPKDWKCVGFAEIDKYASAVLKYHFPNIKNYGDCLLYTSPSPRDRQKSRMPSSA